MGPMVRECGHRSICIAWACLCCEKGYLYAQKDCCNLNRFPPKLKREEGGILYHLSPGKIGDEVKSSANIAPTAHISVNITIVRHHSSKTKHDMA